MYPCNDPLFFWPPWPASWRGAAARAGGCLFVWVTTLDSEQDVQTRAHLVCMCLCGHACEHAHVCLWVPSADPEGHSGVCACWGAAHTVCCAQCAYTVFLPFFLQTHGRCKVHEHKRNGHSVFLCSVQCVCVRIRRCTVGLNLPPPSSLPPGPLGCWAPPWASLGLGSPLGFPGLVGFGRRLGGAGWFSFHK